HRLARRVCLSHDAASSWEQLRPLELRRKAGSPESRFPRRGHALQEILGRGQAPPLPYTGRASYGGGEGFACDLEALLPAAFLALVLVQTGFEAEVPGERVEVCSSFPLMVGLHAVLWAPVLSVVPLALMVAPEVTQEMEACQVPVRWEYVLHVAQQMEVPEQAVRAQTPLPNPRTTPQPTGQERDSWTVARLADPRPSLLNRTSMR